MRRTAGTYSTRKGSTRLVKLSGLAGNETMTRARFGVQLRWARRAAAVPYRMGRFWYRLSPLIGLLLFAAALWVLTREIRHLSIHSVTDAIRGLPPSAILAALGFTVLNYVILTGYDQLAFIYIRRPIPKWQMSMASFVGYAIANNVGFALLSGTSARYRFYSRWGLSGQDVSRVVLFYSGTFWLGLISLGAWSLLFSPVKDVNGVVEPALTRTVGWGLAESRRRTRWRRSTGAGPSRSAERSWHCHPRR